MKKYNDVRRQVTREHNKKTEERPEKVQDLENLYKERNSKKGIKNAKREQWKKVCDEL